MNDQKPSRIEDFAVKLITLTDPARIYRIKKKREPGEIEYAGFNDRVFSSVIDIALCLLLFYEPMHTIAALLFGDERARQLYSLGGFAMSPEQQMAMVNSPGYIQDYLMNSALQLVVLGTIFIVMWSASGATPGKFLLRMRIVDAASGCRPTHRQSILRFLGAIIGSLPLTLGFLWIAFDKKKQGWHDKIAGTVVIRVKHWRLTPPGISEYPEAAMAAEEEPEEKEAFTTIQAPPEEEGARDDTGKGSA